LVEIGELLQREKREFVNDDQMEELYREYRQWKNDQLPVELEVLFDNSSFKMSFDDTYYRKQWYLVSLINQLVLAFVNGVVCLQWPRSP
jgi:hypothetical protein